MFHEKQARDLASNVANIDIQKPVQIEPVMETWEPKIKKFLYSARILTQPYDLKQSLFYHSRQKEKPKIRGVSSQESRQIVDRVSQIMKDTLARGEHVLIRGFGKFSVGQKRVPLGRNPITNKSLTIKAMKVMVFKHSGILRRRLNSP